MPAERLIKLQSAISVLFSSQRGLRFDVEFLNRQQPDLLANESFQAGIDDHAAAAGVRHLDLAGFYHRPEFRRAYIENGAGALTRNKDRLVVLVGDIDDVAVGHGTAPLNPGHCPEKTSRSIPREVVGTLETSSGGALGRCYQIV